MALSDLGRAGGAAGSVALVVDFVVGTGQIAGEIGWFVANNVELLLPLFSTLSSRLAPQLDWLPEDAMQKALLAVAALYVAVLVGRLFVRWRNDN